MLLASGLSQTRNTCIDGWTVKYTVHKLYGCYVHSTTILYLTSSSAIAKTAWRGGFMAKSGRLELGDNILRTL